MAGSTLNRAGAWLAERGRTADATTVVGLAIGLLALPLLAEEHYGWALLVILLNRLIDGLDGAIARRCGPTPFGGLSRHRLRHGVLRRRALASPWRVRPTRCGRRCCWRRSCAPPASFLGRAVMAVERGEADDGARGQKSFFYAAGIIEGARPSWPSFCSACFRRPSRGSPDCSPSCACGRPRPVFSPLTIRARRPTLTRYCMSR